MLDVIADFWKPAKKPQSQVKLQPDLLQVGSSLGFGFVPQAMLSGRRLHVNSINTYKFGEERLTSFVLSQDKDPNGSSANVSMIVAESEGEYYLAISRRISLADRTKLFDAGEIETIMSKSDILRLPCRDNVVDFKGWVVSSYKREIQGLKGQLHKGDFRKSISDENREGQDFEYTLLVSDSNEHAVEIEKYSDGRVEVYATVYRRMNDVGEITHPTTNGATENIRPDIKLASAPEITIKEAPVVTVAPAVTKPMEAVQSTPIKLQEFTAPPIQAMKAEPIASKDEAKNTTTISQPYMNGAKNDMSTAPKLYVQPNPSESIKPSEIKAVNAHTLDFNADAIECDLRVANKIIDEAIRNEMRLTDVVRRIIELPVANPESVQIPLTLTDEDYALLAIRYGISSSDRNAIKHRIISDLGDFSGEKKKAA
jgi:hypothetical protein